jgi:hypothetical protein
MWEKSHNITARSIIQNWTGSAIPLYSYILHETPEFHKHGMDFVFYSSQKGIFWQGG